jgi:DNA-binding MurR/RpiR family transcriptional regulator
VGVVEDAQGVVELVRDRLGELTPAERKVGRALLAAYPSAGLETVARLAERARVSAPTVVRFATRLGFDGFADLQRAVLAELDDRQASPVTLAAERRQGRPARRTGPAAVIEAQRRTLDDALSRTFAELPVREVEAAVTLLADPRARITVAGGRFSRLLAHYLALHLVQLRGGVQVLPDGDVERAAVVHDLARRDVVVLLDFRRYEPFALRLAEQAGRRGARVLLLTDRWLSPAASSAQVVLPSHVDSPSPYDSLVPAMAVIELLVSLLVDRMGNDAERRLGEFEATSQALELL